MQHLKLANDLLLDGWFDFEMDELARHDESRRSVADPRHNAAVAGAQLAQLVEVVVAQLAHLSINSFLGVF